MPAPPGGRERAEPTTTAVPAGDVRGAAEQAGRRKSPPPAERTQTAPGAAKLLGSGAFVPRPSPRPRLTAKSTTSTPVLGVPAQSRARRAHSNVVDGPRIPSQQYSMYGSPGQCPSASTTGSCQATTTISAGSGRRGVFHFHGLSLDRWRPGPASAGRFGASNDLTAPYAGAGRGQGSAGGRARTGAQRRLAAALEAGQEVPAYLPGAPRRYVKHPRGFRLFCHPGASARPYRSTWATARTGRAAPGPGP